MRVAIELVEWLSETRRLRVPVGWKLFSLSACTDAQDGEDSTAAPPWIRTLITDTINCIRVDIRPVLQVMSVKLELVLVPGGGPCCSLGIYEILILRAQALLCNMCFDYCW